MREHYLKKETLYGCTYCADIKKCDRKMYRIRGCRYAMVLNEYGCYANYDAAAEKDLKSVIKKFPKKL